MFNIDHITKSVHVVQHVFSIDHITNVQYRSYNKNFNTHHITKCSKQILTQNIQYKLYDKCLI